MKTIEELLKTKEKEEQVKRIESLLMAANMPVIDLVIRVDPRVNQIAISIIGPDLKVDDIYRILDDARDMLRRQEIEAAKKSASEPKNVIIDGEVKDA